MGATDGDPATEDADKELFIVKLSPSGEQLWVTELAQPNGALVWDGEADAEYLYVSGRTNGALPGFTNAGGWDGFLLKLDLGTGAIVASHQWGNVGLDGYGNLTLCDADHLYVSGAGSPVGQMSGDSAYLVAKHRRDDLSNVWRALDPAEAGAERVAEAWSGLTYVAAGPDGQAERLVAGGWYISTAQPPGGANYFVAVYEDAPTYAETPQPRRAGVVSPGVRADWVMGSAVDTGGQFFAAGFTTGILADSPYLRKGEAFVRVYSPELHVARTRQFGTAETEGFTGAAGLPDGTVLVWGYTYGEFTGEFYGSFDGFALALDAYDLEPSDASTSSVTAVGLSPKPLLIAPNPSHAAAAVLSVP